MAKRARRKISMMNIAQVSEEMSELLDKKHQCSRRYEQLMAHRRELESKEKH